MHHDRPDAVRSGAGARTDPLLPAPGVPDMITFPYGDQQRFRRRHDDVNVLVVFDGSLPVRRATWALNGGPTHPLYVEPAVPIAVGPYAWNTNSASVFRLQGKTGWANVEIPASAPDLRVGHNEVAVEITAADGRSGAATTTFEWDPAPVPLPLDLTDLRGRSLQDVGQAVNGLFELDPERGCIRTVEPIGADVLLLLGSPHGSQEATYRVRFGTERRAATYLGLSDFFVGHSEQEPDLGIKPGYSTAGLATIAPGGWAQMWIARGDCLVDVPWAWLVRSRYPSRMRLRTGVDYRVRHQSLMSDELNLTRFRIWREGRPEPSTWLCVEHTAGLDERFERITSASFGLFQFGGPSTEWSDLRVSRLVVTDDMWSAAVAGPRRRIRGPVNRVRKAVRDRARWRLLELGQRLDRRRDVPVG